MAPRSSTMVLKSNGVRALAIAGALGATTVGATSPARASDVDGVSTPPATATERASEDGAFTVLAMPARVGSTEALAWGLGGYDTSRKGAVGEATAEVRLWGPIALRGGALYDAGNKRMRPNIGGRVQLLRQEAHGIDGALSVFYKAEGFTEPEGEIETFLSIGHRFDRVTVGGSLVYGQDPEGNERDGEVRASVLRHQSRFAFGLDSRLRFAIGTQRTKEGAAPEPTFDAILGATGTATLGAFALFAEVGPSALSIGGAKQYGVTAFGGVGTAF